MHPEAWIWVFIPIAAIFAGVFRRWIGLKQAQLERVTHDAADTATRSAQQVELLEQRVRVLERIVTDKGLDLAEEIEKLRPMPVS